MLFFTEKLLRGLEMKRTYEAPVLTRYGTVEELTQVTGSSTTKDMLFFNGNPSNIDTDGSMDVDCTPDGCS